MPKQLDTLKPIAPLGGRDWLTRGFGLYPCRCRTCDPPKEAAAAATEQAPAAPTDTEPDHEPELEIAGAINE